MNYENTCKLLRKFYKLDINAFRIVEFLIDNGPTEANYSSFTEKLGMDKKKVGTNVRKAFLRLEKIGVVCIVRDEDNKNGLGVPMKSCYLAQDWMEKLLNSEE